METHYWKNVSNLKLLELAQENRKKPTEAESIVWNYLRHHFYGVKFRRQQVISIYIVDFLCIAKRLVIEIDGGYHATPEQQEYDRQRTIYLNSIGLTVLRFTNEEVITATDEVLRKIKNYIVKELI